MDGIIAKNAKQLDICLRMLHFEQIGFDIKVFENEKRKICYCIIPETDINKIAELQAKYDALIQ